MKKLLTILFLLSVIAVSAQNKVNLKLPSGSASNKSSTFYANVAAMQADNPADGVQVTTLGYTTKGDGGGATYYYSASSTATVDGGSVIAPSNNTGRFLAVFGNGIDVRKFGAYGDSTHDDAAPIRAALTYAYSKVAFFKLATGGYGIATNVPVVTLGGGRIYLINSGIELKAGETLDGANSTLKAGAAIRGMLFTQTQAVDYGYNYYSHEKIYIRNLVVDGNNISTTGIYVNNTEQLRIDNIIVARVHGKLWADNSRTVTAATVNTATLSDVSTIQVDDVLTFYDVTNSRYYPAVMVVKSIAGNALTFYNQFPSGFQPVANDYVNNFGVGMRIAGNKNVMNQVTCRNNGIGMVFGKSSNNSGEYDDNKYTKLYVAEDTIGAVTYHASSSFDQCTFQHCKYWSLISNGYNQNYTSTYLEVDNTFAGLNNENYQIAFIGNSGVRMQAFVQTVYTSIGGWYRPFKINSANDIIIDYSGIPNNAIAGNPTHAGDTSVVMVSNGGQVDLTIHNVSNINAATSLRKAVVTNSYNFPTYSKVTASDNSGVWHTAGNLYLMDSISSGYWRAQPITDAYINSASTWNGHINNISNPHNVTAAQVGLPNVENTALSTWGGSNNLNALGTVTTGTWNGVPIGNSYIASASTWNAHISNTSNPHNVTAAQVGLGAIPNVDATNASNITTGTLPLAQTPAFIGDVAKSAGSGTTTLAGQYKRNYPLNVSNGLGSTMLAEPYPLYFITSVTGLNAQQVKWAAVWLPQDATITGVKWYQGTAGNYTANNYNGVGLYTYNGGTLTLVASSTNDGTIWQVAANTWGSKAFSSTYTATAGLYYVAALYSSSAQTTQPSLGANTSTLGVNVLSADYTNSAKLSGALSTQTALPLTIATSAATGLAIIPYLSLY